MPDGKVYIYVLSLIEDKSKENNVVIIANTKSDVSALVYQMKSDISYYEYSGIYKLTNSLLSSKLVSGKLKLRSNE